MKRFALGFLAACWALSAFGQTSSLSSWGDRFYFGGGFGASFGDVDTIEVAPLVGYKLTPRVSIGASAFYRWRSDDRFHPKIETADHGGEIFSRVKLAGPLYAQAEYEFVNYEYVTASGASVRDRDTNVFVGAGFFRPTGGHAGVYAMALYNLTYDANDFTSPYDSPWVYRAGVTIGF